MVLPATTAVSVVVTPWFLRIRFITCDATRIGRCVVLLPSRRKPLRPTFCGLTTSGSKKTPLHSGMSLQYTATATIREWLMPSVWGPTLIGGSTGGRPRSEERRVGKEG